MASSNMNGKKSTGGFGIPATGKAVKSSAAAKGTPYSVKKHANNETASARSYAKK